MKERKKRKSRMVIEAGSTIISEDELGGFTAPFMKTDMVQFPCEATIVSPALLISSRFGVHRVIEVEIDGARYLLRLNKISLRTLVNRYGNDSQNWVDKKVILNVVNVLGKKAIVVT